MKRLTWTIQLELINFFKSLETVPILGTRKASQLLQKHNLVTSQHVHLTMWIMQQVLPYHNQHKLFFFYFNIFYLFISHSYQTCVSWLTVHSLGFLGDPFLSCGLLKLNKTLGVFLHKFLLLNEINYKPKFCRSQYSVKKDRGIKLILYKQ